MCGEIHGSNKAERKEQEGVKRCSKCGETKNLNEFHRAKGGKDGRHGWCKLCRKIHVNKEKKAEWRRTNKDRVRETNAAWYMENREEKRAKNAAWTAANPEKKRAIRHRRRARKTNAEGSFTAEDWKARLAYHGYKCIYCGVEKHETPQGWLTCEHLIPLARGGSNWPSNLAPSCQSCNCSKGTRTHFEYLEYINDQKEV